MRRPWLSRATLGATALTLVVAGCDGGGNSAIQSTDTTTTTTTASTGSTAATVPTTAATTTTEAPKTNNVYKFTQAGDLADSVKDIPTRVYVPNSESSTVSVIDPATFQVIDTYNVGRLPQHVVPSHDMQTLYVNNNQGNSLTPIDPRTGKPGADIAVADPYNLYFTPDNEYAVVIAERESAIDFRDPNTWELVKRVDVPAEYRNGNGNSGVNHAEFTADSTTMVLSCEFSGWLIKLDLASLTVTAGVNIGGKPVDVKLSPDGSVMFNANETRNGVSVVDWQNMKELQFIPTGNGTHGLYPSRDGKQLYVSNRLGGSVTILDFATRAKVGEWSIPGGGSPDMGGVSADGKQLWLSGRYNSEVYVFDTTNGQLLHRIPVGRGPHGLSIFPQPGRFSMGHTGNYR